MQYGFKAHAVKHEPIAMLQSHIEMPPGKNFRRLQILSPVILPYILFRAAPKVVLLYKFLFYRAVQAPIETRALRLQPHQPHG